MNPGELAWRLAESRLREAKALIAAGEWSGAFYLGGYAIELALKARMAVSVIEEVLPDPNLLNRARTHDLLKLADYDWARLGALNANERQKLTTLAGIWSERARYLEHTESLTRTFVADVETVYAAIKGLT